VRAPLASAWPFGLAIGVAAGWFASRVGAPIPWMLGPLFTLAILRVAGVPVRSLPGGRQIGQWIIGTSLGLYFTPHVLREVAGAWPLVVAGTVFAIGSGYGGGRLLSRLAGMDRTTAFFACVPGGASEMATLGHRFGARVAPIAAAQSLRIVIVVGTVPAAYALLGLHGADVYIPGSMAFDARGFAVLMAATAAGAAVANWLRLPVAFVLGSLAVAIPLTAAEFNLSAMPSGISNAGQCLLGCALGARFHPDFRRDAKRFVAAVVVVVVAMMAASAIFGWGLAALSGRSVATLVLATAPGGMAEMCVTAKVLQLGVPLVTSFHVLRIVVLVIGTGPLFGWLAKGRTRPPPGDEPF
jgi:membrane AbrB-like protein